VSSAARVLLTGSTGFVGSAALAALREAGVPLTRLVRTETPANSEERIVLGDLSDRRALVRACREATVVVHSASYVGPDPVLQQQVNIDGTRALVEVAGAAGVTRLVYLSTAGVYGSTWPPGAREGDLRPNPGSDLSRSRLAAEEIVLDADGIVVRPNLVHGIGDRWFLAPLLAVMRRHEAWIGSGDTLLSAIGRIELGKVLAALACSSAPAGVYHAAASKPARLRELVEPIYAHAGLVPPTRRLTPEDAITQLALQGVAKRQVTKVATDNWFDTTKLWTALATNLVSSTEASFDSDAIEWYATALSP